MESPSFSRYFKGSEGRDEHFRCLNVSRRGMQKRGNETQHSLPIKRREGTIAALILARDYTEERANDEGFMFLTLYEGISI